MKYATFDENGVLLNRLIGGVHEIPEGAVSVSESLFSRMVDETDGVWRIDKKNKISKAPKLDDEPQSLTPDQILASRLRAYRVESDHLFMEWQYDQTPESETAWREAVAKIKARLPTSA